jgi:hypothetical protein
MTLAMGSAMKQSGEFAAERLEEEAAQMDAVARFPLPKTGERASGRAN